MSFEYYRTTTGKEKQITELHYLIKADSLSAT